MGERHIRNGLYFYDLQYPQIGLPLVEAIQRIMIRAQILRQAATSNRVIEHPAQRAAPSTVPRWTPNPMIRRVNWSITTKIQWVVNVADSHRNRSQLHRLSFIWPRNVSQDGPESESGR